MTHAHATGSPEQLFGKQVAKLRKRLGFSQEELAFRAGVHRTYISQLERGIKSPTLHVIVKLSSALQRPPSRLVSVVDPS